MNAFTYTPKNWTMKRKHAQIGFFFLGGEFQRLNKATLPDFYPASHSIVLITPAHTQPRALYIFVLSKTIEAIILHVTKTKPIVTIKTTT